ncbi:sugar ABC transporter permease [Calorimonas adulescens]|uniref:Sugar ABC transporter permease n=1 Tax=Calorimonas adulescens TaxID=2606906 RepID=A0A5D8QDY5_9THEO|nr:sugar ABC transporter permease [Calorimonas adulescens]
MQEPVVMATMKREAHRERVKPQDRRLLWISRIIIWVVIIAVLFPVYWVLMASLSPGDAFFTGSLLPKEVSLDNYVEVINDTDFLIWIKNSMILCTGVSIIQLFMTTTSAYAFSRMRFKGRKYGLMTLLILQMFPTIMAIPAIYGILVRINMLDSIYALMLVLAGGNAFNIWLLKGYIDSIPRELDEAAKVDGATHWQIFTRIILPLIVPMLVVIFLFSFIGVYSEFAITSAVIHDPGSYTVALGLQRFILNQFAAHWTLFAAAAVMASLPITIVFMLLQRYLQAGLAAGAVKG